MRAGAGLLAVLLLGALVLLVLDRGSRGSAPAPPTLSAVGALAGADEGYARALEPRPFRFPEDHGPHPDFRTEWWYFTGNLDDEGGRPWAFHFTIFRSAVAPEAPARASPWATNQVYMAHLAVTDGAGERHRAVERLARGAVGLAGARADPFRAWVEDWEVRSEGPEGEFFPLRLRAADAGLALDLLLDRAKGPVLHGEAGLSRKGAEPGNASYYYSFPRIRARGSVHFDGEERGVQGEAWLDREWSTSALAEDQVGWDWFSLQLSDGWEIMFYHIRREDGSPDPLSTGSLVDPDGGVRPLDLESARLTVEGRWRSPVDGTDYPSGWRLELPREMLSLTVTPLVRDQEHHLSVRYWEGAVEIRGTRDGRPVTGRGFAELTGYAPEPSRERAGAVYLGGDP